MLVYMHRKTKQINEGRRKEKEERPCKARLSLSLSWAGEGIKLGSVSETILMFFALGKLETNSTLYRKDVIGL